MKATILALLLMTISGLTAQVVSPDTTGVSMGHLHIITPDLAAQKKIWIDVLGGKLVKAGPVEFAMFPGVLVGLRQGQGSGATAGSIVDHLGFLVKDFEEMMAKMKASAKIVSINQQTRQFFALFPGDITVEFTEDKSIDVPVRHHHIHFATPAEDDMRTWYGKVFGAVPGMRGRFKAADLPGVNLTWKPADQPTAPTKGRSMDHIGFEVTDVAAMCSKAEGAGARIDLKPTTRPDLGLTIAFLTDPWGTSIELTEGLAKIR